MESQGYDLLLEVLQEKQLKVIKPVVFSKVDQGAQTTTSNSEV